MEKVRSKNIKFFDRTLFYLKFNLFRTYHAAKNKRRAGILET